MSQPIWEKSATQYNSLRKAAEEFARSYFDKPRGIGVWVGVNASKAQFQLKDGRATYTVELVPGDNGAPDRYEIVRME